MTHKEFFYQLIEYFGPFEHEAVGKHVYVYVIDNVVEAKLEALLEQLRRSVPSAFVPDVRAIQEVIREGRRVDEREIPPHKLPPPLDDDDMDKVGAMWSKLKAKYPTYKQREADKMEEARRELEEHRRKRDEE